MQRATPAGPRSITTPSASRTSAEPAADDAARPPCLHTLAPAPATTSAAMVDTLIDRLRSPPVPQVSTTSSGRGTGSGSAWVEHGPHQAGHLLDRLALDPQGDDERGDLGRRGRAREHLAEHGAGLVGGQVVPREQPAEHAGPPAQRLEGVSTRAVVASAPGVPTVDRRRQSHHRSWSSTPRATRPELDLARALHDGELLGVAVPLLGGVVLHVPGRPEQLDGQARGPHGQLGGVVLGHRQVAAPTPW